MTTVDKNPGHKARGSKAIQTAERAARTAAFRALDAAHEFTESALMSYAPPCAGIGCESRLVPKKPKRLDAACTALYGTGNSASTAVPASNLLGVACIR